VTRPETSLPLAGTTIVEVSSFVAAPLCGLTLSQLGAEVIRVDPIGGGADAHRWPLSESGASLYWAGLNRGKKSVSVDLRSPDAQILVQELIATGDGIVVTNSPNRGWLSYAALSQRCPDVIHVHMVGRADGSAGVDYTVNAAVGFPMVTGPSSIGEPARHIRRTLQEPVDTERRSRRREAHAVLGVRVLHGRLPGRARRHGAEIHRGPRLGRGRRRVLRHAVG